MQILLVAQVPRQVYYYNRYFVINTYTLETINATRCLILVHVQVPQQDACTSKRIAEILWEKSFPIKGLWTHNLVACGSSLILPVISGHRECGSHVWKSSFLKTFQVTAKERQQQDSPRKVWADSAQESIGGKPSLQRQQQQSGSKRCLGCKGSQMVSLSASGCAKRDDRC